MNCGSVLSYVSIYVFPINRQLALTQQRMDDRRRIKMNSEYHRTGAAPKEPDDDE